MSEILASYWTWLAWIGARAAATLSATIFSTSLSDRPLSLSDRPSWAAGMTGVTGVVLVGAGVTGSVTMGAGAAAGVWRRSRSAALTASSVSVSLMPRASRTAGAMLTDVSPRDAVMLLGVRPQREFSGKRSACAARPSAESASGVYATIAGTASATVMSDPLSAQADSQTRPSGSS